MPESPEPPEGFDLTPSESALLERWQGEPRREWMSRVLTARQAAAKAIGLGPGAAAHKAEVRAVEAETGTVIVEIKALAGGLMKVRSARRGEHVWGMDSG
jgi:hypothetical protein